MAYSKGLLVLSLNANCTVLCCMTCYILGFLIESIGEVVFILEYLVNDQAGSRASACPTSSIKIFPTTCDGQVNHLF